MKQKLTSLFKSKIFKVAVLVILLLVLGFRINQMGDSEPELISKEKDVIALPSYAPEINNTADLTTAINELNKLNVDQELDEVNILEQQIKEL
jgi:hypothetical protein